MNPETIHVLSSLITVGVTGLIGIIGTLFGNKISLAISNLKFEIGGKLSEIRETQVQIKTNQEGHAGLDEQRHQDHDRRIIRLEDKKS